MKRCPKCSRKYTDEKLNFCLDDGEWLHEVSSLDEPATAILPDRSELVTDENEVITEFAAAGSSLPATASGREVRMNWLWPIFGLIAIAAVGFFAYQRYFTSESSQQTTSTAALAPVKDSPKVYWQMSEDEQSAFIKERAKHIQTLMGDDPTDLDDAAIKAIKSEVDFYVRRRDSLSQKQFEEGLRVIYGRATQYAPLVVREYEAHKIPATLGLYQAMIESEYRDCDKDHYGHGLFGFSKDTAAKYGVGPNELCDVVKQSDAAARYMSDLASDFGGQRPNPTLALLAYAAGESNVRDMLRQMRAKGVTEQNFWVILKADSNAGTYLDDFSRSYVPRFFAAATIGETPAAFELTTPPLTTINSN